MSQYRAFSRPKAGTVKWKNRVELDLQAAEALFRTEILKDIVLRTLTKNQDKDGKPFKGYTDSYKQVRAAMGLPTTVDLRVTGDLLRSIQARHVNRKAKSITVSFGADSRGSRIMRPPTKGKARRSGGKAFGTPHNQVLYHLATKTRGNRFSIMGLTPKQRRALASKLRKKRGILRARRGVQPRP